MKQKLSLLFLAFAMLAAFTPSTVRAETTPTIIISEVAWAGSSISIADEWIELTNMTDQTIDVSGWLIDGAASTTLTLPAASSIAPHSTYLIANYDNANKSSALAAHAQFITAAISLPNDKLGITLSRNDRTLVDSAGNGGNPFAGGSLSTGGTSLGRYRSMERRGSSLNGTLKDSWSDADMSTGFKDETLDEGTPGILNAFLQSELDVINAPAPIVPLAVESSLPIDPPINEIVPVADTESVCEDVVVSDAITQARSGDPTHNDWNTALTETQSIESPTTVSSTLTGSPIDSQIESIQSIETSTTTSAVVIASSSSAPSNTLRISELYPHPTTDGSEWIEITNTSSATVITNGWSLADASGAVTLFPDGAIAPGSFLVIENPKGKLNNDGDTVILKDPTGAIADTVQYNTDLGLVPALDESLIRMGTHTLAITTTPTKNADNVVTQKPVTVSSTTSNAVLTNTNTSTANEDISIVATNSTAQAGSGDPTHNETTIPNPTIPNTDTQQPTIANDGRTPHFAEATSGKQDPRPTSASIHLSELYPNTGGNDATDEFIEITNDGTESASLDGWSITDAGGTRFTFVKPDAIAAHAFLAVMRLKSKLTLNNTGDTITLFAPDGSIADTQTYDQTTANLARANVEGVWTWTGVPTPNEPNRASTNNETIGASDPVGANPTATTASHTTSVGTVSARVLTIANAKLATDGTRVTIRGFVTALPNTFNSQTMYVQDDTGGIQIYKSDCKFPTLTLGQEVTVTGTLSHANGEARIKVSKASSMNVSSTVAPVVASSVSTNDGSSSIGSLITIAGMITSRSGSQALIDIDGKNWTIDLPKGSSSNEVSFAKGSNITVSGILTNSKTGLRLKPRSEQDVSVVSSNVASTTDLQKNTNDKQPQNQTMAILLAVLASIAFVGLKLRPHLYAFIKSYGRKSSLALRPQKTS